MHKGGYVNTEQDQSGDVKVEQELKGYMNVQPAGYVNLLPERTLPCPTSGKSRAFDSVKFDTWFGGYAHPS